MGVIVRLYSNKRNDISRFLNSFFKLNNNKNEFMNLL